MREKKNQEDKTDAQKKGTDKFMSMPDAQDRGYVLAVMREVVAKKPRPKP